MASVRVRTATGLALASLVVAGLFAADLAAPGLIPWCGGAALAVLAAYELGGMGSLGAPRRVVLLPLLVAVAAVAVLVLNFRDPSPWQAALWLLGVQVAAVLVGALFGSMAPPTNPPDQGGKFFGGPLGLGVLVAWVGPPMAGLALVHSVYGTAALAVLLVLSKFGDVAGYFVGKAIGRTHPFPKLSPGKTVAGCVASLVAGLVAGAGAAQLGYLPGGAGLVTGAFVGAAINIAAQAADLFESSIKRTAGVKDSSAMAGASGGILDVIDSILFTIPVGLVVFALLVP